MKLPQDLEAYLVQSQEELKQLIRDLCAIPAPSHQEELRARFCKNWFEANGGEHVTIDEALNVLCPYGITEDGPIAVCMAHTDTVFPDREPMPFREDDKTFYCPGVCDDTANLAVMMICARYFLQQKCTAKMGLLFVANACEEGLGNLKGCRAIVDRYGSRIRELVSFDGLTLEHIVNDAVGSHRYEVTVRTEGGHSYSAFGNRNAIHHLSQMIADLYAIQVPQDGDSKTTYNVGLISGGTSVNTIAQEASMLFEYRSNRKSCIHKMKDLFEQIIEKYRARGLSVDVTLLGDRPCAGELPEGPWQDLQDRAADSVRTILGREPVWRSGSGDSNYPLSKGIPSICMTAAAGAFAHTREEELDLTQLPDGCRLTAHFLSKYFI